VTTATRTHATSQPWQLSAEALALWEKLPPRPIPATWIATRPDRATVMARLSVPPFLAEDSQTRCNRKLSLLTVLDWLELQPGATWQQRWESTGAGVDGRLDWRLKLISDLQAAGDLGRRGERITRILGMGLIQLVGADILRPKLGWLMSTSSPLRIANEMARVGDPHGLAQLRAVRATSTVGDAKKTCVYA